MKAVEVMSALLGNNGGEMEDDSMDPYADVEDDELEMDSRAAVGDYVSWDASGGTARGRIEHIMREGVLGVPDSNFSIKAEEGDPAVLIRVYEEYKGGWRETETLVGHKMSELRFIDPLPKPNEEANITQLIVDTPGEGSKVVGEIPSTQLNVPLRGYSLRLAQAKRNNI